MNNFDLMHMMQTVKHNIFLKPGGYRSDVLQKLSFSSDKNILIAINHAKRQRLNHRSDVCTKPKKSCISADRKHLQTHWGCKQLSALLYTSGEIISDPALAAPPHPPVLTRSWLWWTAPCRAARLWKEPGGRLRSWGTFYLKGTEDGQQENRRRT